MELLWLQFGQRYVEEQDDKTVTEWMDKQASLHFELMDLTVSIALHGMPAPCQAGFQFSDASHVRRGYLGG